MTKPTSNLLSKAARRKKIIFTSRFQSTISIIIEGGGGGGEVLAVITEVSGDASVPWSGKSFWARCLCFVREEYGRSGRKGLSTQRAGYK